MPSPSQAARTCERWSRPEDSTTASAARIWPRRATTTTSATTTGAMTTQKTHRHDHVLVTQPASTGPSSEGSTHAALMTLKTLGRSASG